MCYQAPTKCNVCKYKLISEMFKKKMLFRLNLIIVQQDATYLVYYISVGSSTCFRCWHPSSGALTTVITASGIG